MREHDHATLPMGHRAPMRRLTAAVIATALMGGCTTHSGSRTTAKVGGVLTLVGITSVALAIGLGAGNGNPAHDRPLAFGAVGFVFVLVPGLLLGIGGLAGMAMHGDPGPRTPASQYLAVQDSLARERAWTLTKSAAAAARDGDCETAIAHGVDVRALDSEFHATVFMHDVAIKRCLEAVSGTGESVPSP
jgi:hypothetical protein